MAITSTLIPALVGTSIFSSVGDNAITVIMFCNTDPALTAYLDVYVVASGNVTGPGSQILKRLELPPTETFTMDTEKLILGDSDAIYAETDVNDVVCATVSSVSI